jgi:hypothetical protein
MSDGCQCRFCKQSRRIDELVASIPVDVKDELCEILSDLRLSLDDTETELAVLHAKIDGTWPAKEDGKYFTVVSGKRYEVIGVPQS